MNATEFGGVVMDDKRVKSTEELAGQAKIDRLETENDLLRCTVLVLFGVVVIVAAAFIFDRIQVFF